MNPLLEQLHDIEGLDTISWWPLAIGWWFLIITGILILCIILKFTISRIRFKRSWKNDTFKKLAALEENLSDKTARETIITLSEYLRRIALRKFSRKECAGFMGKEWLNWLSLHDPKGFDWEQKGELLIEVPYAPASSQGKSHDPTQIKELIQAVRNWVH